MYENNSTTAIVPAVLGTGTAAVLPATGADVITSLAIAVAAGLVTWGVIYFISSRSN